MLDKAASEAPLPSDAVHRRLALPTLMRALIILFCILGLALRVAAARGDLWLDEIWSFVIVAKTTSFADVVLKLPNDNNHVLNSLWLRLVGPAASTLVVRSQSILFGTLCIPVAARLGARISPTAAVIFAAMVAIDYPFVQFGSEARGYSGLILAALVALDAIETRLDHETSITALIVFALATALGTFSHLIMLEVTCLLCTTFAIRLILAKGLNGPWLRQCVPLVMAASAGTLPAFACLVASLFSGLLHTGFSTPFSFATLVDGLGGMVRATIGFWPAPVTRTTSTLILLFVGLGIVAALPLLPLQRRVLPALGLIAWPVAHATLHIPNQLYARFHIVSGICLALFLAEVGAWTWRTGPGARAFAFLMGLGFVAGQSVQLAELLTYGRGHFAEATTLIARQGSIRVSVLPAVTAPETAAVMRWFAKRGSLTGDITLASDNMICTSTPDWLVIVHRPDDPTDQGDAERLASLLCADRFAFAQKFPSYGMSGFAWTLFKRRPTS